MKVLTGSFEILKNRCDLLLLLLIGVLAFSVKAEQWGILRGGS